MSMFEYARAPRLPVITAVAGLLVALVLLAALQYRWVGQVGEAERARLQAGAHTRVEQFAQDFDREVTRAFALLQVDEDMLGADGGERYAARIERWAARSEHPGLVAAVYVVTPEKGTLWLRRFDKAERAFVAEPWPPELSALRARLEGSEPGPGRSDRSGPRGPFGMVEDEVPALVSPIFTPPPAPPARGDQASPDRSTAGERVPFGERGVFVERGPFGDRGVFVRPRSAGFTVVRFDRGYIERDFLPALAGRYFAIGGEFDYCVVVTTRREPRTVVYRSDPADRLHPAPDATAGLLDVRFDQLDTLFRPGDPSAPALFGRRQSRDPRRATLRVASADRGSWEVGVTHRAGSLEEVVAHTRHRNLLISFGTLLLLGASAVMVALSSQRARRLAAQHVEFVAGVSHELRTPVAVVVSAGENLADGLVRDPGEVKLYGATIRDEGRRLAEMIEQVLEFAGIDSRERQGVREPIVVSVLVDDALKACAGTLAEARIDVERQIAPGLPAVVGDRAALRRALQNLIQNSARHAASGRWIGVSAAAGRGGRSEVVRITVRDRGPGIPRGEESRIFKAFYRGRQALAAGVSGSGLGLSLVQRIMEAHGGTVEVESTPGAGSAFSLVLPAATAEAQRGASVEGHRAQANPTR
jgi:signal transduction histidine kinase